MRQDSDSDIELILTKSTYYYYPPLTNNPALRGVNRPIHESDGIPMPEFPSGASVHSMAAPSITSSTNMQLWADQIVQRQGNSC